MFERRRMAVCMVMIALLGAGAARAQSAAGAAPAGSIQTDVRERVDKVFAEFDKPDSPGCSLAIVRDGQIIYARGYGMASLEHANPITPQTVFDIGSTSKQFSAMCVHMLAREGKLSLDDDIRKWMPEMRDYGKPITIRHLLHHTSGIRDYLGLMQLGGRNVMNDYSDAEVIALIARQRELNFVPGDEHLYSNSGFFLLSAIVQRAAGVSMRQYAAKNIFEPLGMKSTHFHDDPLEVVKNRALGYSRNESGGYAMDISLFHVVGDGGVYTTVEDLAKWDRVFYDSPLAGGKALIDGMLVPGKLNNGTTLDYASGLTVPMYRGLRTIRHGGAWAGYRAEMLRFPDQRTSVIVLANLGDTNPSALANAVADIVLEKDLKPLPAAAASNEAAAGGSDKLTESQAKLFAGLYWEAKTDRLRRIAVTEGKPKYIRGIVDSPGASSPMVATGERSLRLAGVSQVVELAFAPAENGKPKRFTITVDGGEPSVFEALDTEPMGKDKLAGLAGEYDSAEVDVRLRIAVEGDRLTMSLPLQPGAVPLVHVSGDWFSGPVSVRFERAPDGSVKGFRAGAGRMRNIEFTRVVH